MSVSCHERTHAPQQATRENHPYSITAVSDLGHSSEASLRYEEAKLLSRGSVDEQDGGTIGRITFLYYIGWDDLPLAIFQVLPLV